MKKFLLLVFISIGFTQFSYAQRGAVGFEVLDPMMEIPDHTPMMNDTWEKINLLMYKVTKKGNETIYTPHFPDELKKIEKTIVELPGYIVPLNAGRTHTNFMLSVLPIMQCSFCGTNDIPPMIEIFIKKGKNVKYSEDPIRIRGRVHLNSNMQSGNAEIQILDAELINY